MQRHPCGTCASSVTAVSRGTDTRPQPILTFLLSLGVVALFAVAILALTTLANPALADVSTAAPSTERQRELIRFVRQECGFCHGLRLTGGLGSPLTATALADKPREALEATILYGRTGTAMPGWTPHLSESDTQWIVTALLKGFPE
jgi:cytochrome c55X